MSLELLKHEILKPSYCMCNECQHLGKHVICDIYNVVPPKNILGGNLFKEKNNKEICEYFEKK